MWRWEWECSIQKTWEVEQWQLHLDGRKSPSSRPSSVTSHAACVSELMVCVVLCLLRDSAVQGSQCEAQCLSCSRLPCCDGHLHYCHLPAAPPGLATWSQDPLPELGTQDLKVLLSLELWSPLLSLKPTLNLTSYMDFPHLLFKPSSLPIPYHKLFSYLVTNEDQPSHLKKTWVFGFCELFLTSALSYCRFHNVYCTYIASSCVNILSLPASHLPFPSR